MFKNLVLTQPLAVIDLETTGLDAKTARIVEISVLKVSPDGTHDHRTRRLNPQVPIPPESTAVHGITDEDVADAPTFASIATSLAEFLVGCDLCGFNLKRYDLRILVAEFRRAGVTFPLEGRAVVDPMEIYHQKEPRHLAAAVRWYLGREHAEAHSAAADVLATVEIFDAMLARYEDLPTTPADLQKQFSGPVAVDSEGFFTRVNGEIRFVRGVHRGQPLAFVARNSPDYLTWMLRQNFATDTATVAESALRLTNAG